jgi:hypothetical protein
MMLNSLFLISPEVLQRLKACVLPCPHSTYLISTGVIAISTDSHLNNPITPTSSLSTARDITWIKPDVPLKFSKQVELSQYAGLGHGDWTETLGADFCFLLLNNALIPEKLHALHYDFEPSVGALRVFVSEVIVTIIKCQDLASV